MVTRALWTTQRFSPFDSPRLLQLAFNMPVPISNHALLHKTIIKRYMPRSYFTPINDETILSVIHDSIFAKTIQKSLAKLTNRTWGIFQRHFFSQESDSIDDIRANLLFTDLKTTIHDLLIDPHSISLSLFEKNTLTTMLNARSLQVRRKYLRAVGLLITIEQWRLLAREIATQVAAKQEVS